jgi:hypothetical protein
MSPLKLSMMTGQACAPYRYLTKFVKFLQCASGGAKTLTFQLWIGGLCLWGGMIVIALSRMLLPWGVSGSLAVPLACAWFVAPAAVWFVWKTVEAIGQGGVS